MNVERKILTTVLELTRNGPIDYALVGRSARIPVQTAEIFLKKLQESALIRLKGKVLEVSPDQRVKIALRALELNADFVRVGRLLQWKEFENITTTAFEAYNYSVKMNFRFKAKSGKRWEIDLLAWKQPTIATVDCKRWERNWTRTAIIKLVNQHVEKTKDFTDILSDSHTKIDLCAWKHATVIPIVLSLLPSPLKYHDNTPIVSVLQLQSFLNELPAHVNSLTHFTKKFNMIDRKITDYNKSRPL